MELGVFDLSRDFWRHRRPYVEEIEEGCGGLERIDSLSGLTLEYGAHVGVDESLRSHSIGPYRFVCSFKRLLSESLYVRCSYRFVDDGRVLSARSFVLFMVTWMPFPMFALRIPLPRCP